MKVELEKLSKEELEKLKRELGVRLSTIDNILDRQSAVAQADLSKYQNVYKNIPSELLKKQEDETRLENEEKMKILNKKIELLKSEIELLK